MAYTFDENTKYLVWYFNIVNNRVVKKLDKSSNTDLHHIYPKSIFGDNNNLVRLTIREHILCHVLLWKHFRKLKKVRETKSSWYSIYRTISCAEAKGRVFGTKELANRILTNREELSLAIMGENNPFFGKKHSEESRKKISEAGFGRVISEETKTKQRIIHKERMRTDPNWMDYLRKFNTGRKLPKEHKEKLSISNRTHIYTIQKPDGNITITDELTIFCNENFLSKGSLFSTLPGKTRSFHKGFKLLSKVKK